MGGKPLPMSRGFGGVGYYRNEREENKIGREREIIYIYIIKICD